jgi:hypothetical protein
MLEQKGSTNRQTQLNINTPFTLQWKVAPLFYEDLLDFFYHSYEYMYSNYSFTLKSCNWFDEIQMSKKDEEKLYM